MEKLIKNFDTLATSKQRKAVLDLIETGLESIEPENALNRKFSLEGTVLHISDEVYDLSNFDRLFLIGFGKGSAGIAKIIEGVLGNKLTEGYVIDTVSQEFSKIHFSLGTHPLPSQQNVDFTNNVLRQMHDLTTRDLVLVVICGGGSAMFEAPFKLDLETLDKVFDSLIKSGATIFEMNIIRKHLSNVKGGGLAKQLYPATVASLLFSDVPGSTPAVIASGPTVMETSTIEDVEGILNKYNITNYVKLSLDDFAILPKDGKYFESVKNILMLSDVTVLDAMVERAKELGYMADIFSDRLQGNAKEIGKQLLMQAKSNSILLAGGETTVVVKGKGQGGRNQTVVLAALPYLTSGEVIASVGTDGVDFYYFAGAIGDMETIEKAKNQNLAVQAYLDDDNSYEFFTKVGDGIYTGRLESNVADIIVIFKP